MERERYSLEDKTALKKLLDANPQMKVADVLSLALQQMPHRSSLALRQQLFKLRRESDPAKKKKKPVTKKLKKKAAPVGAATKKKTNGKHVNGKGPLVNVKPQVNGDGSITLQLSTDKLKSIRVTGEPSQIAKLLQSL